MLSKGFYCFLPWMLLCGGYLAAVKVFSQHILWSLSAVSSQEFRPPTCNMLSQPLSLLPSFSLVCLLALFFFFHLEETGFPLKSGLFLPLRHCHIYCRGFKVVRVTGWWLSAPISSNGTIKLPRYGLFFCLVLILVVWVFL